MEHDFSSVLVDCYHHKATGRCHCGFDIDVLYSGPRFNFKTAVPGMGLLC